MTAPMTPDDVRRQIIDILNDLRKAPDAVGAAMLASEQAILLAERDEASAFLNAEGNIEERKAQAKLKAAEAKDAAAIAVAAAKRVNTKTQVLRDSVVASQALLKSIQTEGA